MSISSARVWHDEQMPWAAEASAPRYAAGGFSAVDKLFSDATFLNCIDFNPGQAVRAG